MLLSSSVIDVRAAVRVLARASEEQHNVSAIVAVAKAAGRPCCGNSRQPGACRAGGHPPRPVDAEGMQHHCMREHVEDAVGSHDDYDFLTAECPLEDRGLGGQAAALATGVAEPRAHREAAAQAIASPSSTGAL